MLGKQSVNRVNEKLYQVVEAGFKALKFNLLRAFLNPLFLLSIALTVLLGLAPLLPYVYFAFAGWPPTPYVTHQGPLWYHPYTQWGRILFLCWFLLLFVLPLATVLFGVVSTLLTKNVASLLLSVLLASVQIVWGFVDVFPLVALTD